MRSYPTTRLRELEGFNHDLVGADGYTMPATQHDAVLWLSGSAYDVIFDTAREALATLAAVATLADETSSWPYRHDRDLTGFIDGSENPSLIDAAEIVTIPEGRPGAGGSILLLQKWTHDVTLWESLTGRAARADDRTHEGRERRARRQAGRFARRPHRSGSVRQDLPPQHAVRDCLGPRHDVRRLQRRPAPAGDDAREHGREWPTASATH